MKYKFIVFIVFIVVLFYRPLYSILLLLLLYSEYYYAVCMIVLIKTNKTYCKISIPTLDLSNMTNIDVWLVYSKINAFIRVYYFFTKNKKIRLYPLLLVSVIYIFNIPFRLFKLAYYFIKSNENFHNSLVLLTLKSHDLIRDLKIEVLENKIYLNCNNLCKLTRLVLNPHKLLEKDKFCKGMSALQKASKDFTKQEESYGKTEVNLCKLEYENGKILSKVYHYTVVEKDTSIHATSNVKFLPLPNQRIDGIVPALVSQDAVKPGTVITKGVSKIKVNPNKSIWVPNSQLNIIKANHAEFIVDQNIRNYQIEKEKIFNEILKEDFKLVKNIDTNLLHGLRYDEFTRDLNVATEGSFENEYTKVYEEILNSKERGEL